MPAATRLGDQTTGHGPSPPRPSVEGSDDVTINGKAAVRVDDKYAEHPAYPHLPYTNDESLAEGSATVTINGKAAGRVGDSLSCGDTVAQGSGNVFIGDSAGSSVSVNPATGKPIVLPASAGAIVADYGVAIVTHDIVADASVEGQLLEDQDDVLPPDDVPTSCLLYEHADYLFQLSDNFNLKQFTIGATFPHKLREQHGLSFQEIVCNLQGLCEVALEPIITQYPDMHVNSGFRKGSSRSQHERGQGADLVWRGKSYDEMWEIVQWIRENVKYDQLIWEHGNNAWIHISWKRTGSNRGQVLTMHNHDYSANLTYYPSYTGRIIP